MSYNQQFNIQEGIGYAYEQSNERSDPFLIGNELGLINNRAYKVKSSGDLLVDMASAAVASPMSFDDYKPQEPPIFDINSIILPPPNFSCYVEPPVPKGTVTYLKHTEPTMCRTLTLNFNTTKTVVRENIIHHQHTQTVITNVNRNHWHTQRVVVKDNNYHHYLINNLVKINDIHHQKIEHVRGEGRSFKDYKQTQKIEAALCDFSDKDAKIVNPDFEAEKKMIEGAIYSSGPSGGSSPNQNAGSGSASAR